MKTGVKDFINSRKDDFIRDLETLVNIDSGSDNPSGIAAVGQFLMDRLEAIGFTCRLQQLGDCGVPCLYASNGPADKRVDVMFLGHMDTVFPVGEAEKRPFAVDGRRATGPGVCDMKGGLVTALHVLEALHHDAVLDRMTICVCFNGDEEIGSASSRTWIEAHARNSWRVIVFEPCRPGFKYVLQRKGGGGFKLTAGGVAAHAGVEPEKGVNAAVEIAHQVLAVQRFNDQAEKGISAHVTVIQSGGKTNIIPDEAHASVDVRVARKEQIAPVEAFFSTLPDHTHVPGVMLSVSGGVDRPPMEADAATLELWALIEAEARRLGLTIETIATGGCSDGNFTSAQGIPTIDGMGPVGANAHRSDEYVDLDSVAPQIELIASLCEKIAKKSH